MASDQDRKRPLLGLAPRAAWRRLIGEAALGVAGMRGRRGWAWVRLRGRGVALALVGAVLIGTALRFWRLGALELIGDESYYWLWSRHLDWAYWDHPAGVALTVWLSTALGGTSEAGIRWLNTALGAACILLTYALGARALAPRAGLFAALVVAVGAPYVLISRFVYTDALQLALLLLNLVCFWRLVEDRPAPRLATAVAFGASLAALFNTKYNAYLYAAALLAAVLLDHRWLLGRRQAWLAAGIAAAGLLPVIGWNAAHNWVSFRWQLAHAGLSLAGQVGALGKAYHALAYLTWPLAALAVAGLGRIRRPAERLLTLVALFLLVPVVLSAADSPRNLCTGMVPLLLLAGERWRSPLRKRTSRWAAGGLAILAVVTAGYGLGSVRSTFGPTGWPASSGAPAIRQDAAGWQELGQELAASRAPILAVDYSIAAQIAYYTGRPAYTSWGQYRLWGVPASADWTVVSLAYVPPQLVDARLRLVFQAVAGPRSLRAQEWGTTKGVSTWQARLLRVDTDTLLRQLDFWTLIQAGR